MFPVTPVMHPTGGWRSRTKPPPVVIRTSNPCLSCRLSRTPSPSLPSCTIVTPLRLNEHGRPTPSAPSLLRLISSSRRGAAGCSKAEPHAALLLGEAWTRTRRMGETAAQAMQCRVNNGGGDGGGGGMRTVECLRGRLLAERVASKAAKEEADQLAKRLDELEKKLAGEVKVRDRAERRLRRAIKKLESLRILDVGILSDGSVGSLSSNGRSGLQAPEAEGRDNPGSLTSGDDSAPSGPPPGDGDGDGDGDSAAGGSSAGSCTRVNSSQDGSWCSVVSEQSRPSPCMDPVGANNNSCSSEESAGYHDSDRQHIAASDGPAKSDDNFRDDDHDDRLALVPVDPQLVAETGGSAMDHYNAQAAELHARTHEEEEERREEEQNKLAIVLVEPQPQPESGAHGDVESVLLALRRVKEQLRYTIQRQSELVAHRELYGH
ncbi:hypothetical protein ACP4OV_002492 [Aristida adscensionis]